MSVDDRGKGPAGRVDSPAPSETTSFQSSSSAGSLFDKGDSTFTQAQVDEIAVVEEILALLTTPHNKIPRGETKQSCRIDIAALVEAVLCAVKKPCGVLFEAKKGSKLETKALLPRRKKAIKQGFSTTLPNHAQENWCNNDATGLTSEGKPRKRQTLKGYTLDTFDVERFDERGKDPYKAKIVETLFGSNQIVLPDDLEYCKSGEEKTRGRRKRYQIKYFMQDQSAVETLAVTLWASIVNPDTAKDVSNNSMQMFYTNSGSSGGGGGSSSGAGSSSNKRKRSSTGSNNPGGSMSASPLGSRGAATNLHVVNMKDYVYVGNISNKVDLALVKGIVQVMSTPPKAPRTLGLTATAVIALNGMSKKAQQQVALRPGSIAAVQPAASAAAKQVGDTANDALGREHRVIALQRQVQTNEGAKMLTTKQWQIDAISVEGTLQQMQSMRSANKAAADAATLHTVAQQGGGPA